MSWPGTCIYITTICNTLFHVFISIKSAHSLIPGKYAAYGFLRSFGSLLAPFADEHDQGPGSGKILTPKRA